MTAHSIKNSFIIHFMRVNTDDILAGPHKGKRVWFTYLCCGSFTVSKATEYESEVTCKNCLRLLRKDKI